MRRKALRFSALPGFWWLHDAFKCMVLWVQKIIATILSGIAVYFLLSVVLSLNGAKQFVQMGVQFCPPSENVSDQGSLIWDLFLGKFPRDPHGEHGIQFKISPKEITPKVIGYQEGSLDVNFWLTGEFELFNADDLHRAKSINNERDLWNARGIYVDRTVTFDPRLRLYKVFAGTEEKDSWLLLNTFPDQMRPVPHSHYEFVVASCFRNGTFSDGSSKVNCSRGIFVDNMRINYNFAEQNAHLLSDIDKFLSLTIESWRDACK